MSCRSRRVFAPGPFSDAASKRPAGLKARDQAALLVVKRVLPSPILTDEIATELALVSPAPTALRNRVLEPRGRSSTRMRSLDMTNLVVVDLPDAHFAHSTCSAAWDVTEAFTGSGGASWARTGCPLASVTDIAADALSTRTLSTSLRFQPRGLLAMSGSRCPLGGRRRTVPSSGQSGTWAGGGAGCSRSFRGR